MHRSLFTALWCLLLVMSGTAHAADDPKTYQIDPAHTRVVYFVNHLGFSKFPGTFNDVTGTIRFAPGDVVHAGVDVTINTKSLSMGNAALDTELLGAQYFNVAKFPTMHFVSTNITRNGPATGILKGDLTLLGVTKPVTLNVRFNNLGFDKYTNKNTVGFSATGVLNRADFGMKTLLPDVGDKIDLRIELEAGQAE